MDILGEIFIYIVGGIAEIIGEEVAKSVAYNSKGKRPIKIYIIAIISGLLSLAFILALGFASYILFVNSHPIAGFFVSVITFFFLVFVISVIGKTNQIIRKNRYPKEGSK